MFNSVIHCGSAETINQPLAGQAKARNFLARQRSSMQTPSSLLGHPSRNADVACRSIDFVNDANNPSGNIGVCHVYVFHASPPEQWAIDKY